MRPGEDGDEGVVELLDGLVADSFLLDEDMFLDRVKELERANLDAEGGERGVRRVVLRRLLRAGHGVPPENEEHYKSLVASTAYERTWSLFCTKFRYVTKYIEIQSKDNKTLNRAHELSTQELKPALLR